MLVQQVVKKLLKGGYKKGLFQKGQEMLILVYLDTFVDGMEEEMDHIT